MHWRIVIPQSSVKGDRSLRYVVVMVVLACLARPASADEQYHLLIGANSADRSLIELAAQTDRTLVYSFNDTKNVQTRALTGIFTLNDALDLLLRDTELTFSIEGGGAIRVTRKSISKVADQMKNNNRLSRWLSAVLAGLSVTAASADETQQQAEASRTIEEVLVTATRRETSARDTPISISAFNDETLSKQGIENFEGLVRQTPGVTFTGANSLGRFVVRGIQTSSTSSSNGEQRQVAVYFDEVPVSSFSVVTPNLRLFDIERVEVLRGPQGTSFGSGSLSGAVRVVTQKADPAGFDAAVRLDYGNIDKGGARRRLSGMVNLPVSDTLAFRGVVYDRDEGGFIDNQGTFGAPLIRDENEKQEDGYRFSSVWLPSETLKMTFAHSSDEQYFGGPLETQNLDLGDAQRATFFPEELEVELKITSLQLEYDMGWAMATHTTSLSSQLTSWDLGLDAIFGPILPLGYGETLDFDTTIHEFRLVSSTDASVSWLAGLYSYDLDADGTGAQFVDPIVLSLFGVDSTAVPKDRRAGVTLATVNRRVTNEERAVYGEFSWSLTDALTLTAGARYTQYRYINNQKANYVSDILVLAFSGGGIASIAAVPDSVTATGDKSSTIFKASLQWQLNENTNLYASASEGFRRSHPNFILGSNVDPNDPSFIPKLADADTLWNYELGYKALLLDSKLALNAAVYFINWTDAQVSASRQSDAAPYTTNAGDIEAYGVEADFRYLISEALEIGGSMSLSDSEVVSIDDRSALASGLTKGAALVGSDTQLSAFLEYRLWTRNDASINTRLDIQYASGYANGPRNIPGVGVLNPRFTTTDSIVNINGQVGYENNNLGLYLYAENIGSNNDRSYENPDPFSNNNVVTLAPRTIGLRLDYRF